MRRCRCGLQASIGLGGVPGDFYPAFGVGRGDTRSIGIPVGLRDCVTTLANESLSRRLDLLRLRLGGSSGLVSNGSSSVGVVRRILELGVTGVGKSRVRLRSGLGGGGGGLVSWSSKLSSGLLYSSV